MQKERQTIKVAKLLPNNGQLGWLPINPRQWTMGDVEKTANSLTNDPDFLEDRPPLAIPFEDKFVVFAGNLRLTAAMKLKLKELPVVIYTPENETDQMTIKRRAILDNGAFGAWDFDALANEWDDLPLGEWGVPAWTAPEDDGMDMGVGNETAAQQKYARVCGFQIPLSEVEEARMKAAIESYVEETGLVIGFFTKLLDDAEQQTDDN